MRLICSYFNELQNIRRRVTIERNVRGRDMARFVADAQRRAAEQMILRPGYSLRCGGQPSRE